MSRYFYVSPTDAGLAKAVQPGADAARCVSIALRRSASVFPAIARVHVSCSHCPAGCMGANGAPVYSLNPIRW